MEQDSHLVLCVDDEMFGLQVRKILLERAGYRVLTAKDGFEGLKVFEREPVEAVVLDYSMPGMHGGEVATKMRQVKPALANYRHFLEMSQGKNPDQEFLARQRSRILEKEANR